MRMPLFLNRLSNVSFVTELLALKAGKRRLCSFSMVQSQWTPVMVSLLTPLQQLAIMFPSRSTLAAP